MQKIFYNGDIVTMENEWDQPEAVLVEDGKIVAVGDYDTLSKDLASDCERIDLAGGTLMPSFIDGHGHIVMASVQYGTKVDLEGTKNFDEIVERLQAFMNEHHIPEGQPIVGYAYDNYFLEEQAHPGKAVLDRVSTKHPVIATHTSGHVGCANSLALANAGIDEAMEDPQGGHIDRYPGSNEPSGF